MNNTKYSLAAVYIYSQCICCPVCAESDPLFTAPHGQIVQTGAGSYWISILFKQILNA